MRITLEQIARLIDADIVGEPGLVITGISGIKEARKGDITFLANPKYAALIETTKASAVIVSDVAGGKEKAFLKVANPSLAFSRLVQEMGKGAVKHPCGIDPKAVVSPEALLEAGVAVGPGAVVEEGAQIGAGTVIYANCYVGRDVKIGRDCIIYPNVSIREAVTIGSRVVIHCGSVLGSDGFGFITIDGKHHKVPQIGIVIVEDDVEIGANVTIDRARFDKTLIGKGTKIDNLVQIAHNVVIGENCIIVAQAGIAGSSSLGNNVTLAGQVGMAGHIALGDNTVVGAQSGVSKSFPAGSILFGSPARSMDEAKRLIAYSVRLPQLHQRIKDLEKRIKELEEKRDA